MNRIKWNWLMITLGVLLISLTGVIAVAAQERPGDVISTECTFEGYDLGLTRLTGEALGFVCGYVVVPERHANPDGPAIRIPYAIHHPTGTVSRPDPLVIAQGGPGGDAFELFTLLTANTEIAADRDIIIFNQRGTPYAEPELSCPETEEILADMLAATEEEGERLYNQAIDACYARLVAEGIDVSAYNSLENAADVPVLIGALGYDEYNFYGVSYGTLLGLHLMRNQPDGLRSVILDSVVTPDINFVSEIAASENRVLREIFSWCETDAECREQYPDLEQRYFAMIRQYNENPVTVELTDPETGQKYEAYLNGAGVRSIVFQLLYNPGMNVVLPRIVSELEMGDTRYIRSMWPLLTFDQLVSEGMYYSVICAEDSDIDVDAVSVESLYPDIAETARDDLQGYVDSCARWPVTQLPPSVDDPVISDIPTLLLSGQYDPITPPAFAEAAAATLGNATVLVDPQGSHGGTFLSPCTIGIVADFLNDPTVVPDSSCLTQQEKPPLVPQNAITVPYLGKIVNSINQKTLVELGFVGVLLVIILSPFIVWPLVYLIRAFRDGQTVRSPEGRRARLIGRTAILVFGLLALLFAVGFVGFVILTIASNQSLLLALALPPSAAPVLWIPTILLFGLLAILFGGFLLWRHSDSGSTAGKIYYALVSLAAVAFIVFLGTQELLLPPV